MGGKLYRPIGMEWFDEGHWKIAEPYNNDRGTVAQYLGLRPEDVPPDKPYKNLKPVYKDGVYYCEGSKGITLEAFKEMDIDIIIASWPPHYRAYTELRDKYKPNARVICHAGNNFGNFDWDVIDNFMGSIAPIPIPAQVNHIFYHQEFDTKMFNYTKPERNRKLKSFLHIFKQYPDYQSWYQLKDKMKDWEFYQHGSLCDLGVIQGRAGMADAIRDSNFVMHMKQGGDGFGYIMHYAFAMGRPIITKREYYQNCLADELLDENTAFLWHDEQGFEQNANRLLALYNNEDAYYAMCKAAYDRFCTRVHYSNEEVLIRKFLSRLI